MVGHHKLHPTLLGHEKHKHFFLSYYSRQGVCTAPESKSLTEMAFCV